MPEDDRDLLDLLKSELAFIEKGGYGRSVRTPWEPTSAFQDSPSCPVFPSHSHTEECILMSFVPPECRTESAPCHHIPLNEKGETVDMLERQGDQQRLEEAMASWLRAKIAQLEDERARQRGAA
ncbi:MAG TPA: hypothetical protein VJH03_11140 [Blastocatellia bacterium]|nr:hypothetical protein [Blastocatellia bacterium]